MPRFKAKTFFTSIFKEATSSGLREYDGYNWRHYGVTQGLPSDFVRCVLGTRRGDLWVSTDRGAGIYDGKTFRALGSETNLAGPSVRRMSEDIDGTIWFCSDPWSISARTGGVTSFRNGQWRAFGVKDGLPSEYVVNYFRDSSNRQWVVTKDGVARWASNTWITALVPSPTKEWFSSGCFAEASGQPLLFSNGFEDFLLKNGEWKMQTILKPHPHGPCSTADGMILSVTGSGEDRYALSRWSPEGWMQISAELELSNGYVEDVQQDPEGNIWIVGFETLHCWERNSQWKGFPGITKNNRNACIQQLFSSSKTTFRCVRRFDAAWNAKDIR